jgi:imidazolonepropionase-like amidohydrolase
MTTLVLENATVLDPEAGSLSPDRHVVVSDGHIAEILESRPRAVEADRIDLRGRTLMPGLIDAHVHVTAYTANFAELARSSPTYVAAQAARIMGGMLDRGFTTVRDVGGADFGLARAVDEGLIRAPRLIFGGKALSQTGGHGDVRGPGYDAYDAAYSQPGLGVVVDGVAEVRRAARAEIRRGAWHIKIMGGGGIASPTDRITSDQFSEEEIAAAVEEAAMANLYVVVHAYTVRSVARSVRLGVRSVEHGNLIGEATAALMKEKGAFLVPTLATYRALVEEGVEAGLPAELVGKTDEVLDAGIRAVELAYRAGVPMAYGTDLLGSMHRRQLSEFKLSSDVVPAVDLVRAATVNGARLLRLEKEIGRIKPGYRADLIAVDGNPLDDIGILADPERSPKLVMKSGEAFVNQL